MGQNDRESHVQNLINDESLLHLDETSYWELLQRVVEDVTNVRVEAPADPWSAHELCFQHYALLAMSPLGGFCWPGAERTISSQTYEDVRSLIENTNREPYLSVDRDGIKYPVSIHPIVEYALLSLIHQRMRVNKTRNNAPSKLHTSHHLAPTAPNLHTQTAQHTYRVSLIQNYLTAVIYDIGIHHSISIDNYLATARFLLIYQYDLDVLYAMLGGIQSSVPTDFLIGNEPIMEWAALVERAESK